MFLKQVMNYNLTNNSLHLKLQKLNLQSLVYIVYGGLQSINSIMYQENLFSENNSISVIENNKNNFFDNTFPWTFNLNTLIKDLKTFDNFVLIDSNLRFEASVLNILLAKSISDKNSIAYNIGVANDMYFSNKHLNNSTKSLIQIAEGKHLALNDLRLKKKVFLVLGSQLFNYTFGSSFLNLYNYISWRSGFYSGYVFSSILEIVKNYVDHKKTLSNYYINLFNKNNNSIVDTIYLSNTNSNFIENKNIKNVIVFNNYSNFLNKWKEFSDTNLFFFASKNIIEQNNLLMNIEGRVQKSNKAVNSFSTAQLIDETNLYYGINWIIFEKYLNNNKVKWFNNDFFINKKKVKRLNILKKSNKKNDLSIFNSQSMLNYFYYSQDKILNNINIFNIINYSLKKKRIYLINFSKLIDDFYLTDNVSKNSLVMLNCSLFNSKKTNFIL